MAGTRYKLIGECVVFIVKSPDIILKRVLTELKQVHKIKSITKTKSKRGGKIKIKLKRKKRKARFKKGSQAAKDYMASIRP
jgi:hypothetical protein